MFKECTDIKSMGGNPPLWQYKIIDDDFEERVKDTILAVAIIDVYSKRNLLVAPNLIRAMLWAKDTYDISLNNQVSWNKRHNPRWHEVEKDLQKYLLFS